MKTSMRLNWTRDEHILAFNLYCQIPFGSIHIHNVRIIELAKILGRSVGSVSYKLANFARLDPALQARGIRGMTHGAKGEEEVWREFALQPESLAYESERLLAARLGRPLEEVAAIQTDDLPRQGSERDAVVQARVNQGFFRRRILSAYGFRCCVTGMAEPTLLVASHISPWATDPVNRLNPRNGLCLNALHDRAFDRGLMWVDEEAAIRFSPEITKVSNQPAAPLKWMTQFEGQKLLLPPRFSPDPLLLKAHAARARGASRNG